jgi:signal transduction histidine kinase
LAKAYIEGEQELLRRSKGQLRLEDIRRQAAARLAGLGEDFVGFRMLFLSDEPQLMAVATALIRAYARGCRRFFGPKNIERIVAATLKATPWKDVEAGVEKGLSYAQKRMRSLAECGEIVAALLDGWFRNMQAMVGVTASVRMFELAYEENEAELGFLPMSGTLLSLTPHGVLLDRKAKRLHELESETMTQARSIRTADIDLSRQAAQLQATVDELQETRQQLEAVSAARSEFIDVVSHQFRTPLSSIRWNGELMTDALAEKKIDAQFADPIETVRVKSVYLIETLDRVFATLDIETGKVVIDAKPGFLWEAVQDVHNQFEKDIARHGIKWKFQRTKEQLKEIPMDKAKIATVLKILIGNAITYTPDAGSVTVSVGDSEINGNEYQVFAIKDSGIGIPKEEAERVFEKFYRAAPAKLKAPDGTGLGMFIVKHFVEAHRGLVRLESEGEGKGTTVSFALPVK